MRYKDSDITDFTDIKVHDISYQLGAYYDMRYMQFFTRCKFILGLSCYSDDDTILDREYEIEEGGKNYRCNFMREWHIQTCNSERSKIENEDLINDPVIQACVEIAESFREEDPYDKVEDEFLLHTYPDMDEQELHVCRETVWAMWDIGTAYYFEVVARIIKKNCINQPKLFANIKEVEDTIQRLVHYGILTQEINYIGNPDRKGNIRWRYEEPHIVLSFTKDPSEAIGPISEIFGQMIKSFISPRINYPTITNKLER